VLVSGTNGIVINAGASDVINLRGLYVEGLGTGLSGVNILSAGEVHMTDMVIKDFRASGANLGNGVLVQPSANSVKVSIDNSFIGNNGTVTGGAGVLVRPNAGTATVKLVIRRSTFEGNAQGVKMDNAAGGGAQNVQFSESTVNGSIGNGLAVVSTAAPVMNLFIDNSVSSNNGGAGVKADGTATTAIATIGRSTFTGNGNAGMLSANGGQLNSYRNNQSINNGAADSANTQVFPN
jgi:hypothetical protein